MTSAVKQALPQVLAPKAGVDGRDPRNRAPQVDFADTLATGKSAKQAKAVPPQVDRQDASPLGDWPRLTARLGTAIDRMQGLGAKLVVEPAEHEEQDVAERSAEEAGNGVADESESARPPVVAAPEPANDAVRAFMPYSQAAPLAGRPVDNRNPDASRSSPDDPDIRVAPNEPAEDGHALARADDIRNSLPADTRASHSPAPIGTGPVLPAPADAAADPPPAHPANAGAIAADTAAEIDRSPPDSIGDGAKSAPRVTVLSQQNIPAPMPSTTVVLAQSIAASDLLPPANAPVREAIHASATHVSAQSLKIQLHPAELGMVTATLRFAGEQLSIELHVENQEAHRQLSSDSETIVKSLRDLGYDIDRVTVSQPTIASTTATRADVSAGMPAPQGRAPDQFGSGMTNGGGAGTSGRQSEQGENPRHGSQKAPLPGKETSGGGLYI